MAPSRKKFDAFMAIVERVIGKPVQAVVNANLELTREQREAQARELLNNSQLLPAPEPDPEPDGHSDTKPN